MYQITLNVEKIILMKSNGPDIIYIYFEGTNPMPGLIKEIGHVPFLKIEVAAHLGEKYIEDNFKHVPFEIMDIRI
jgi:hypothetical protein